MAEKLGERGTKAVEKVQRMVPSWASMVPVWWSAVNARVAAAEVPTSLWALLLRVLIPAMYIGWVSERNHMSATARASLVKPSVCVRSTIATSRAL